MPGNEHFYSRSGWVQVLDWGGQSSTRYHGSVGAVRVGSSEWIINHLNLNNYVMGVVPREVPGSWKRAAIRAQAIAARTYGEHTRDFAPASTYYDICDNTNCQMYGGMARYDIRGHLISAEDPAAVIGNRNKVLRYQGDPILAMYSASNGGATVAGSYPYLPGQNDPYDTPASGDPYLNQSTALRPAQLARAYRLRRVTSVQITERDGNGPWGGRVVAATIVGRKAGKVKRISTSGDRLGGALGVWTNYLLLRRG